MSDIDRLLTIMARLRDPDGGCPWDLQQSFATIVPFTIEEAYEVADAIEREAFDELRDELGDLLFQVVFYAQMAREQGRFDFSDVVAAICEKLVRRHPHVFGEQSVDSAERQTVEWEAHKAAEREARAAAEDRPASVLDGVPRALPALGRAGKLQRRAARSGFDWPDAGPVIDKVGEELDELREAMGQGTRVPEEIGDLLFAVVNLARHLDVDPETALREANRRFEQRFHYIEEALAEGGRRPQEVDLDELERLWGEAKRREEG